jgi:hypothetical protein
MAHPILPLILAVTYASTPAIDLNAASKDPIACLKTNPGLIYIAGRDGPADGPDPRGGDPNDELHDPGLPANQHKNDHKAPKDPYDKGRDPKDDSRPY